MAAKGRTTIAHVLFTCFLLIRSAPLVSSWDILPQTLRHSSHFPRQIETKMTSAASNDIVCSESTQDTFRGKSVLLTGASGGLGKALALQLAHGGAKTLVLSARSQSSLQEVADECQGISPMTTIHIITCDLSNPDSVTVLGKEAVKLCDVDILINNGGVSSRSRFVDTTVEVDAKVMQINFLSGASLAKAVVPGMVERNYGTIIWISSVQGLCKCVRFLL